MLSNGALTILTGLPSPCPRAFARSTSSPTIVLLSSAKNSLGGYDASAATTISLLLASAGGSVRDASFVAVGIAVADGRAAARLPLEPDPPQPATVARESAAARTAAVRTGEIMRSL